MHNYIRKDHGFIAAISEYNPASVVMVGAPLDITVTFRPGTRDGPTAIRVMSQSLEDYSLELGRELNSVPVYDAGDLVLPAGDLAASLGRIEDAVDAVMGDGKLPLLLGGEHLLTLPAVKAAARRYPDLIVVQFDAHADLLDSYEGATLSHATVMRRVAEIVGEENVVQLGIRSATRDEVAFARDNTLMYCYDVIPALDEILQAIKGRPVYVTVDIDVVDPAFAPGVGTPEPGGIDAREFIQAAYYLYDMNVIGMDLVEVNPAFDRANLTALLAAKFLREAILCLGRAGRAKIKVVDSRLAGRKNVNRS
ncbi:MAG: agmatinase [Bacillota bacterium]|nr:agmatinase [Bacillota bacterium]